MMCSVSKRIKWCSACGVLTNESAGHIRPVQRRNQKTFLFWSQIAHVLTAANTVEYGRSWISITQDEDIDILASVIYIIADATAPSLKNKVQLPHQSVENTRLPAVLYTQRLLRALARLRSINQVDLLYLPHAYLFPARTRAAPSWIHCPGYSRIGSQETVLMKRTSFAPRYIFSPGWKLRDSHRHRLLFDDATYDYQLYCSEAEIMWYTPAAAI